MNCSALVKELRAIRPNVLLIVTSSRGTSELCLADHYLDNFDPASLLKLLRELVPTLWSTTYPNTSAFACADYKAVNKVHVAFRVTKVAISSGCRSTPTGLAGKML